MYLRCHALLFHLDYWCQEGMESSSFSPCPEGRACKTTSFQISHPNHGHMSLTRGKKCHLKFHHPPFSNFAPSCCHSVSSFSFFSTTQTRSLHSHQTDFLNRHTEANRTCPRKIPPPIPIKCHSPFGSLKFTGQHTL